VAGPGRHAEFNRLFLEHARQSLAADKTAEQAMADFKLPDKFKDYNLQGGRGGPGGELQYHFPGTPEEVVDSGSVQD
jgi:hypothetical protein